MASTNVSTSSLTAEDHKRTVDEAFLNKLKSIVERLRLENATLKKTLDLERSEIRALKAQHESSIRTLKTDHRRKEELLEKQIKTPLKNEKDGDSESNKLMEIKRLTMEIQSLKVSNKSLQEKLKVAAEAECARAAELRAQVAKHDALERAATKDARAQCHKLLEEIKSKERIIIQLRREVSRACHLNDQAPKMEGGATDHGRKLRMEQSKEKSDREDLKTDIQHRKETFYRQAPSDGDSAVSSAPTSLSPQLSDMWACGQCRSANERAEASAKECTRLDAALRDARDQLELMEFRLLELEDAGADKGARELTDNDSGCVSPGSRIKDSASPELKRMDSGYKSPRAPGSPCNPRRHHEDFKEDFVKAQVLADILDRNSESSDSLRSNPVKDHLEQMILNAASAEDRHCLEQVQMLLYNFQALSSSVSEDECYQAKPKRICDLKQKFENDIPSSKTHKAIATVTPYQQNGYKSESLDSLCDERKPSSILQESGIFEEAETECRSTQTDVNDSFECNSELNTEIQRLNSIREKLERQGRNRSLSKDDGDGLECKCVRLGKKHKQYYERRLKFLEGKISIYEAAQDVKEAKLAERLQREFYLENRVQDLEVELIELHEKYIRLEEDCCELEEIENDTRLHWQQLEMDYELCAAQLRDMTEQRECSRAQAERLIEQINKQECTLKAREHELLHRLTQLEKAVPALIAWNIFRTLGTPLTCANKRALQSRIGPLSVDAQKEIVRLKRECELDHKIHAAPTREAVANEIILASSPQRTELEEKVYKLIEERRRIEENAQKVQTKLEARVKELEAELGMIKRQIAATVGVAEVKAHDIEHQITDLEAIIRLTDDDHHPASSALAQKLQARQAAEAELKSRIAELEKRERAYLEMLTQADDMWAEMEGSYKKKIHDCQSNKNLLQDKVSKLEIEKETYKNVADQARQKIKDLEEEETAARISLEKAERDVKSLKQQNSSLSSAVKNAEADVKKSEVMLKTLEAKFKEEIEQLRAYNKAVDKDLKATKDRAKIIASEFQGDLNSIRRDLSRVNKQNQDLEVTNSELKEEVESLEKQLALTQKTLNQCKRKCDEKIKTLSHELSIKTEELEELRSETMRQTYHASRIDLKPDRTEYVDEGYSIYTAVPKKTDYGRMHHSMSYITPNARCSCPSMRSQLVSQLIEDLFDRIHNTVDEDLTRLCRDITPVSGKVTEETKAKITNYLLMAISKELVRSIGDADAKTDTEEWHRAVSTLTHSPLAGDHEGDVAALRLASNAGVLHGAARLASVSCACAATRLAAAVPNLASTVKECQEEVLDHGDVKVMEEQLANAIESIVNCPSCALGTNAIVWSTDV